MNQTIEESVEAVGVGGHVSMSGGRILAEMLKLHGVGPMFGMGGFQLLPFYGAVRELGLEHHLINDERSGAFAADAYARVSGRVGVCDATLGPGATNLVTGLVESLNAGIPIVAIVGDAERTHTGKHMTQEGDQVAILKPCAKLLIRVERPERIPELVRRAFTVATAGRPGPVVLDIPEDVVHAVIDLPRSELWADERTTRPSARRARPDAGDVGQAADLLAAAQRPLLLAGGGVHLSNAYGPLLQLAEAQDIPVAHTISGKGAIACTHPLSVGVFGRYSRIANDLIARSDLLIAVGAKLGEIATQRYELIKGDVPLVHMEVDAEEIGRTTRSTVALIGDAGLGLEDLLAAASARPRVDRSAWTQEATDAMAEWRSGADAQLTSSERPIGVGRLVHELNRILPADAVVVADGGFASHWTALLYDTKAAGRGYVSDRGFASIGYGLPGAMGAALAEPGGPVVGITGDGGFNMGLGELETAVRIGRPFVLIVVNNAASGYVKALQHVMLDGQYQSSDLSDLDYAPVARGLGAEGIRVDDPDELGPALERAIACGRPCVVDVAVTRDPAQMLPGVDNRLKAAMAKSGGRVI
ncbi:MAG TPA: thiamine pyrophosphate-binding protein [Capillimicrobium sp.]|nr:thiamine pyrophosphate-binding protein [Capillimicrobium sp.]